MTDQATPPDVPAARTCYERAASLSAEAPDQALGWLRRVVDGGSDFSAWQAASHLLAALANDARHDARRSVRLAVLGSYTTNQLVDLIQLAAFRFGVWVDVYQADYDQVVQEVLDERSGLYAFEPDLVLFAVDERSLQLPEFSETPAADVEHEVDRWIQLFRETMKRSGCRIVHHSFVSPPTDTFGHLSLKVAGSRAAMVRAVNVRISQIAPEDVAFVDCDALAARLGKQTWFDDRYWYISKQAVSLSALPELARHTAAVIAAQLGLSRKALVLDLDNTLWGGMVGEDGVGGIVLGPGSPEGEAFVAFQRYCAGLSERGIVLAVCSKNDEDVARGPFREHPDMVLREDDIAVFMANWAPKADNIARIAQDLGLGLDGIVFADDDTTERDLVRQLLPDVEVVALPPRPFGHVAALAGSLHFETAVFTDDDRHRADQYRGRAAAAELERTSGSLEDSLAKLEMEAQAEPFSDMNLPRVVQLVGKTNQFNVTTRRYGEEDMRRFMSDPDVVTLAVRLCDRFVDHGLVSVVIGHRNSDAFLIDSWVMSCRVIGRGLETWILDRLVEETRNAGLGSIEGRYAPTDRNGPVADLFERLGFDFVEDRSGMTVWHLPEAGYSGGSSMITSVAR